ncbi:Ig-like domain-containing protein [Halalkalibacter sp. APA_J-10(15)]|uniref:Ig-like domain-containing protein n=1 Tax=Halalkalibacter sp. APA_J-10(15) TaxID=2933805 RepID=UPI001FF0FC92|nr:Ig-like domain-containing protein [Halalkalibacter sp. APA_J-10(15)]MCK0470112.1 Ig-like domain-containing protein [Halalkalibacter sp. APA_J-10(15)]
MKVYKTESIWKRCSAIMLSLTLILGSFATAGVPTTVMATEESHNTYRGPGGVNGASLWLKASDEAEVADGKVDTWTDLTTGKVFSTDETYNGVTYDDRIANFNPAVIFNGGKMDGDEDSFMNVKESFAVAKHNNGGALFATKPNAANLQGFFRSSTVQFINHGGVGGVGGARTLSTPNEKYEDFLRLLSVSSPMARAWENGVAGPGNSGFTDNGSAFELKLGVANNNSQWLNGHIAELIVFDDARELTVDEHKRINSYLSLKYGITLKDDNGNPTDYIASDGTTTMWTASDNDDYGYRITGIGRDDDSALKQKQSKSVDLDANVTIALGDSIATTNVTNSSEITVDKTFFTFSDDDGSKEYQQSTIEEPETGHHLKKMKRVYKVEASNEWFSNDSTLVTFKLDVDEDPNAPVYNYYLLTSEDGVNFNHPTVENQLNSEYEITVESSSLEYFTFAKVYKEDLKELLDDLPDLDENDYTTNSWQDYEDALDQAEDVLAKGTSSQQAVDEALEALQKAIEDLTLRIDITEPDEETVFIARPEIKGTVALGSEVTAEIQDRDGNIVNNPEVTIETDGTWRFTPDIDLDDGEYVIVVTAEKGGKSNSTSKELTIDAALPTVNINDPGTDPVDDATPTFTGTATPGSEVTIELEDEEGNKVTGTVTADEDGNWTYTPAEPLENGPYAITVTAEKDGKTSEPVTGSIEIAVIPEPEVTLEELGTDPIDDATPTFTGTVTPGSEVTIELEDEEGNKVTGTVTADEDGNWTYTPAEPLENGPYAITVTAEKDGKTSEPATGSIEIAVIPEPEVTLEELEEGPIDDATPTFTGTATPGSEVTIELEDSEGNKVTGTVTADEDGNWTYTPAEPLENGRYDITVTAEKDGKTSEPATGSIEIAVVPEPEVTVDEPNEPIDTTTPTITGTATAGSTVTIELTDSQGNKVTGTVTADEEGNWSFAPAEPLENGTYAITVTAELNGKISPIMAGELTIDTVDKSPLKAEIDLSENLDEENYSTDSWEAYQTALTFANSVFNNPEATQQEIDDAQEALKEARDNLTVDKSALQAKTDESEGLVGSHYSQDSWADYQEALEKAEVVLADPEATQTEVDNELAKLIEAYNRLTVDKAALQERVNESESLTSTDYSQDSWKAYEEALEKAEEILSNPNATQDEVNGAYATLVEAYLGLTVYKQPLEQEVAFAERLVATHYSEESWNAYQKALEKAEAVLANPEATQAEVDAVLDSLVEAYTNLTVTKEALVERVKDADKLKGSEYSGSSWKAYEAALKAAKEVLDNPNATQEEVNAAYAKLLEAYNGLTVDKEPLQKLVDEADELNASDYSAASWANYQKALKQAEAVLNDPNATQSDIAKALQAVTTAKEALTVDKQRLEDEYDASKRLNEKDYEQPSWRAYQEALNYAKTVLDDPNATQSEVDAELKALIDAREALKEISKDGVSEESGLPDTATNVFNWMIVGAALLLIGIITLLIQKRRKQIMS